MSAIDVTNEQAATEAEKRSQELQTLRYAQQLANLARLQLKEARELLNGAVPPAPRPPEVDGYINDAINTIQQLGRVKLGS